jgi:hypothetical protein
MRRRSVFGLALVVCSLLMIGGVSAQGDFTDEELEWIDFVAEAYDNTADSDSFRVEYDQSTTQELSTGSGRSAVEVSNDISQAMTLEFERSDDGSTFSAVLEQTTTTDMSGQSTDIELTIEMVLFDDELYMRVSDVSPRSASSAFPDDWVNVADEADRYPFLAAFNVDSITSLYDAPLGLEIDEDTLLSIEELDSDEIDGQEMRVFEFEYDAEALFGSKVMAAFIDALSGMAQGVDVQDLIDQMAGDTEITYTVWINEEDMLVYRFDSVLNIDTTIEISGTEVDLVQEAEASVYYSDFGEDFDIEEPDI